MTAIAPPAGTRSSRSSTARIGPSALTNIMSTNSCSATVEGVSSLALQMPALTKHVDLPVAETLAQGADRSGVGDIDSLDREASRTAGLESGKMTRGAALRGDHSRVALQPLLGQRQAQPARCANDKDSRFSSHVLLPFRPGATDASDAVSRSSPNPLQGTLPPAPREKMTLRLT